MKRYQFARKKNTPILTLAVFVASFLLMFSSCTNKKGAKLTAVEKADVDASCAILFQKEVINEWETPSLLKSIDYLVFYTANDYSSKNYKVAVQAFSKTDQPVGGVITLTSGTNCNIKFSHIAIGENLIPIGTLNIIAPGGTTLNKFSYIKLTPRQDPTKNEFLSYSIAVIEDGVPRTVDAGTLPCPPCYNCKPIEPGCVIKYDTTGNGTDTSGSLTPGE